MLAVVLVGGLGTRLRSVVSDVPKPLAPVRGRPFLAYLLDRLDAQGITEVMLATGYLGGQVVEAIGDRHGRIAVRYSLEESPLGTGGAVRRALAMVDRWPTFVLNGDTFLALDYRAMARAHQRVGASLTVAVTSVPDAGRYGRVLITNQRVTGFEPKGVAGPGLINAGVYLFNRDTLPSNVPQRFSLETDFLSPCLEALAPLAFDADGYFIDIGVPEDYQRAQREL